MHLVSFDPTEMKGKIIANTTRVNRDALDEILAVFYDTINSGRAVSPMIRVTEGKRLAKIKTACSLLPAACSLTLCDLLLKHGIPVHPRGGGLVERVEREPTRFTDMLMYWATTVDPIDVLTAQGLMDITGMMRTGNGRIVDNLHEAAMIARDRIEEVLEILALGGFTGVMELGPA